MDDWLNAILSPYFPDPGLVTAGLSHEQFQERTLAKGEILFAEGDSANCIYFVSDGRFAVRKAIGIGERTQAVALLNYGTIIGEGALISEKSRGATVLAVEDSKVIELTKEALAEIEQKVPDQYISFVKKILAITTLRLQKSSERLALVL